MQQGGRARCAHTVDGSTDDIEASRILGGAKAISLGQGPFGALNRRGLVTSALLAAALGGCGGLGGRVVRFRLTLHALIDGQRYEGSSVNQIEWIPSAGLGPESREPFRLKVWAEAPVLDLGRFGTLFGLLRSSGRNGDTFSVFTPSGYLRRLLSAEQRRDVRENPTREPVLLRQVSGEHHLVPQPALVRFSELGDPRSVMRFDASRFTFSGESGILPATISITSDPITRTIADRLPWLADVQSFKQIDGGDERSSAYSSVLVREHFLIEGFEP